MNTYYVLIEVITITGYYLVTNPEPNPTPQVTLYYQYTFLGVHTLSTL